MPAEASLGAGRGERKWGRQHRQMRGSGSGGQAYVPEGDGYGCASVEPTFQSRLVRDGIAV